MMELMILAGLISLGQSIPPERLELETEEVRPGLVAEYHSSQDPTSSITRIEAKPAFTLGRSNPHPRLPDGPFEVVWTGILSIRDTGPLTFSAFVGGELTVAVDGVKVLDGRGTSDTSRIVAKESISCPSGYYKLLIRYRSLPEVPARIQLWWEGPSFAREPIPAWRFAHLTSHRTRSLDRDEFAARGRDSVERHGCARCHSSAIPGVSSPPPGPSLADAGRRLDRIWLMNWLADPSQIRPGAHMPALFTADRSGFVERWIVTVYLTTGAKRVDGVLPGDHRRGRITFLSLGCAACHFVPDLDRAGQKGVDRFPLVGLGDRMAAGDLVTFLGNPHGRYPDGRMPRLPVVPDEARDIAAYLLTWSKPTALPSLDPPTPQEIRDASRRFGAHDLGSAATVLLREKGCMACHPGLGESRPRDVPIRVTEGGCLGKSGPRYMLSIESRIELVKYLEVARKENHLSPFATRQHRLAQVGCVRCHQRDSDRPPPIEEIGSTLGGAFLEEIPFLRTPRLTFPHQKLIRSYLATTVREGSPGLRWSRYRYRMPGFGPEADTLIQALAEADGELPTESDFPAPFVSDPTLGTLHGSRLIGFQGYACASCHVWNGQLIGSPDPGATGPDLTRTEGRIRRDWFDRFLEAPHRFFPNTPMPAAFQHGKPATLTDVLDGDSEKQKDALWAYVARGKDAPAPTPPLPLPITSPIAGEPILVAQIPVRLPDGRIVESLSLLTVEHDLLIYDLAEAQPHTLLTGGQILRTVQGRLRQYLTSGTPTELATPPTGRLLGFEKTADRTLEGYDRLPDGVRIHWQFHAGDDRINADETLRIVKEGGTRKLIRELRPARDRKPVEVKLDLPAARSASPWKGTPVSFPDAADGSLERPGYRAHAYPRPKTVSGDDRILPAAVAVRPRDGRVFVASLKTGELFALEDSTGDGKQARFVNYARGLYQDALSMLAEDDGLYVLHRRNLTRIVDSDNDGLADRFDRIAALPHGIVDTYDYAYGLARDKAGRFVLSYAPYANASLPGSGGAIRLQPGKSPEEFAYGMRNPLGWCAGPDGEIFFTDNQGEWVATNKLCHVSEGRYYGFPNPAQRQHLSKPAGKTTVWIPYSWARSINGVAYDHTGGKFGPFAGQFYLAELMFGGAIIRANVEKVNGVYQGACFPFWGKGLLGPVSLAFDPKGPLYVGGITEPGWMAQPDRGALFRIDYTGSVPFEMQSIHVRPRGFKVLFTRPVDRTTAANPASYRIERYRYEYTGSYGSPEFDRTTVKVERIEVSSDGCSVDLTTTPLIADWVYLIDVRGVRSVKGEQPVHPTGAYTLNEIPSDGK